MLGHDFIDGGHLLLGVLRADEAIAAVFAAADIGLEDVRRELEAELGRGAESTEHMPFTASAKRTLELSLREAMRHGQKFIAPGHVALALIGEPAGPAMKVLAALDADLDALQGALTELVDRGDVAAAERTARARFVMRPARRSRRDADVAELRAQRDLLADGLRRYARHDDGCPGQLAQPGQCSCGLGELLAIVDERRD